MKLVSILNEELVFTNVNGVSRAGVYTDLLRRAQSALDTALNIDEIVSGMIEREDALQLPYEGVAFPHLRLPQLKDLYIIVGVLPKPVQLKSIDPMQCRLVVMSLISPETSDLYLKALAALVRFLGVPENRERLCGAGSAAELLGVIREADLRIRSTLVAEDIVTQPGAVLHDSDTLSTALDLFSRTDRGTLPVLDGEERLVGELTAMDVLTRFIPEYIFRMDNLDFLTSFEPFNRIFQEENLQSVRDYMREPSLQVTPETPLIQFTVKMVKNHVNTCFVVDSSRHFKGEIMVKHIVKKVLRG